MSKVYVTKGLYPNEYFDETANFIARCQQADGSIPWFDGAVTDPWDHVEAAMGLSVAGRFQEARRAYRWLQHTQRRDGSWWAAYRDGAPVDATRIETNFVAYAATGLWHYYLASTDLRFVQTLWPSIQRALDYVIRLQSGYGEVYWAVDPVEGVRRDALITGCSSIHKSLECGANLAALVGADPTPYLAARHRLGYALRHLPHRFDRTWAAKDRYSMDWFYPVLSGVVETGSAQSRLAGRWHEFVVPEAGCLCVSDEPWVTVAESCELVMALVSAGDRLRATELFSWLHDYRHADGSWWTGWVHRDAAFWPDERPTWTAGAVLLAADAIACHSGANAIFSQVTLPQVGPAQNAEGFRSRQRVE